MADRSGKSLSGQDRLQRLALLDEGTFTLELDVRAPITVKAGEALVEPPKVAMKGYSRSATEATRVVIFYVSANDTPFLDLLH